MNKQGLESAFGFRVRPLRELDIDHIVRAAGGRRVDEGKTPRADFVLGDTVIELKMLDEEGFEKVERQEKLARLFRRYNDASRPVIVLDRAVLPKDGQRIYENIVEGPIKGAIRSAKDQLRSLRAELPETTCSVVLLLNNGYASLDLDELVEIASKRARNYADEIDAVIVAGCYYYSDGWDSFFLWPFKYVPINLASRFELGDSLRDSWFRFANSFMTDVVRGDVPPAPLKSPVLDTQFDSDGVTYVKPAPPMGRESEYFVHGRPRKDTSGINACPPVAATYPDLARAQWELFRTTFPHEYFLCDTYDAWLKQRADGVASSSLFKPFVAMPVTFDQWKDWCTQGGVEGAFLSVREFANHQFDVKVRTLAQAARERNSTKILPPRYVLVVTEEIGQDRANDVSHIALVTECADSRNSIARDLVIDARIFHEHALMLACAYAIVEDVGHVLWGKNLTYSWA